MTAVTVIKLVFILLGLIILLIGTLHSIKKSGESIELDKLPPTSYPSSYFKEHLVEDDPEAFEAEDIEEIEELESEELNLHDSE